MSNKNINEEKQDIKKQDNIKADLETIKNNNKTKLRKDKIVLIILTTLSGLLVLISFFWIPVLSAFGVDLNYSLLVLSSPIIVAICAIPLAVCVILLCRKVIRNK